MAQPAAAPPEPDLHDSAARPQAVVHVARQGRVGRDHHRQLEGPLLATGIARNPDEVRAIFRAVDKDGSGEIGFKEFMQVISTDSSSGGGGGGGGGDASAAKAAAAAAPPPPSDKPKRPRRTDARKAGGGRRPAREEKLPAPTHPFVKLQRMQASGSLEMESLLSIERRKKIMDAVVSYLPHINEMENIKRDEALARGAEDYARLRDIRAQRTELQRTIDEGSDMINAMQRVLGAVRASPAYADAAAHPSLVAAAFGRAFPTVPSSPDLDRRHTASSGAMSSDFGARDTPSSTRGGRRRSELARQLGARSSPISSSRRVVAAAGRVVRRLKSLQGARGPGVASPCATCRGSARTGAATAVDVARSVALGIQPRLGREVQVAFVHRGRGRRRPRAPAERARDGLPSRRFARSHFWKQSLCSAFRHCPTQRTSSSAPSSASKQIGQSSSAVSVLSSGWASSAADPRVGRRERAADARAGQRRLLGQRRVLEDLLQLRLEERALEDERRTLGHAKHAQEHEEDVLAEVPFRAVGTIARGLAADFNAVHVARRTEHAKSSRELRLGAAVLVLGD